MVRLCSCEGLAKLRLNLLHHGVVDTSERLQFVRVPPTQQSAPTFLQSFGDLLKPKGQSGRHRCQRRIARDGEEDVGLQTVPALSEPTPRYHRPSPVNWRIVLVRRPSRKDPDGARPWSRP